MLPNDLFWPRTFDPSVQFSETWPKCGGNCSYYKLTSVYQGKNLVRVPRGLLGLKNAKYYRKKIFFSKFFFCPKIYFLSIADAVFTIFPFWPILGGGGELGLSHLHKNKFFLKQFSFAPNSFFIIFTSRFHGFSSFFHTGGEA